MTKMLPKLFATALLVVALLNGIHCQQMVNLLRSASAQNPQNTQSSQQSPKPQTQSQPSQPQLLSLEQQQQLLQQLAILTAQQQQQQQQQQQPRQSQPQMFQQPSPQQQFFDPNQQLPPFFGPQGSAPPQQQFFAPQFFAPQQQFSQQPPQAQAPSQPQPQSQQPPATQGPQINWGKCPQLEPSEKEKMTKAQVITKCLETTPLPQNITRDTVELHREQIAACALQSEGWFTANNAYDFGKAETEIKNKKLTKQIEDQVLGYHKQCKEEAEEKFPNTKNTVIAQIQLYQACMDYFISDVCGIEVNEPEAPQFTGASL